MGLSSSGSSLKAFSDSELPLESESPKQAGRFAVVHSAAAEATLACSPTVGETPAGHKGEPVATRSVATRLKDARLKRREPAILGHGSCEPKTNQDIMICCFQCLEGPPAICLPTSGHLPPFLYLFSLL